MSKPFASQADLQNKIPSFIQLSENAYAYTTEGDPNSGVIIGSEAIMVIEAQATPLLANQLIQEIRKVSDLPIRYLVLSHYHAVRTLGASAFNASYIIASSLTYKLIKERGEQDWESELRRFPRLFTGHESIPGLTWPNLVFNHKLDVNLGDLEVQILHIGSGHTEGDSVVWIPDQGVLFAGDLVEYRATPYCGDAFLRSWPETLQGIGMLSPKKLVPGRGDALLSPDACQQAINLTSSYVTDLYEQVHEAFQQGKDLKTTFDSVFQNLQATYGSWHIFEHCMPFNVTRAYDEVQGIIRPEIWTRKRDQIMWDELYNQR